MGRIGSLSRLAKRTHSLSCRELHSPTNPQKLVRKQKTRLLFAVESSYYVAAMAEDLTPKQIFMQKLIAVVFTLALFVLMVWGILYMTVTETTTQ
jgi:hypothetical protein